MIRARIVLASSHARTKPSVAEGPQVQIEWLLACRVVGRVTRFKLLTQRVDGLESEPGSAEGSGRG